MLNFAQARTNMVDSQLRPNGVTDGRILDAMQSVMRENFVGQAQQSLAYMDGDVALKEASFGPRFLIEPMAFARMLQFAELDPSDRVLDIGAASGYGAAVLSTLVLQVTAVEQDAGLAALARQNLAGFANVAIVESALAQGSPKSEMFDLVVIEGRIDEVPNELFSQVKDGGRIVAAIGSADNAQCCVYRISGQTHTRRVAFDISVSSLPGFGKSKTAFAF
jgi:protein-L-isoaspartate(D-aspartate) O-methyltransferase